MAWRGTVQRAHVIAWELVHGPRVHELWRECGEPGCVNPEHYVDQDRAVRWVNMRAPHAVRDPEAATARSKSGVRNVSWHEQTGKWHVRITRDGEYQSFGLYDDLYEAAEVARRARAGSLDPRPRRARVSL